MLIDNLNNDRDIQDIDLSEEEEKFTNEFQLLSNKKVIYVCNTDEVSITKSNNHIDVVEEYLKQRNQKKINISANIESQLSLLEPSEKDEFLKTIGIEEPGLNKLITEGYKALQLITFFTSGPKETKAWTVKSGSFAPQAAGKIHTDFEKGFIRAETINYDKLDELGSYTVAKDTGKIRSEGRDYLVEDGDVMNFRFNT